MKKNGIYSRGATALLDVSQSKVNKAEQGNYHLFYNTLRQLGKQVLDV